MHCSPSTPTHRPHREDGSVSALWLWGPTNQCARMHENEPNSRIHHIMPLTWPCKQCTAGPVVASAVAWPATPPEGGLVGPTDPASWAGDGLADECARTAGADVPLARSPIPASGAAAWGCATCRGGDGLALCVDGAPGMVAAVTVCLPDCDGPGEGNPGGVETSAAAACGIGSRPGERPIGPGCGAIPTMATWDVSPAAPPVLSCPIPAGRRAVNALIEPKANRVWESGGRFLD